MASIRVVLRTMLEKLCGGKADEMGEQIDKINEIIKRYDCD